MDTQPAAPRGPPRHTGYCDWLRECDLHDPGGWLTEWDLCELGASEAGGGGGGGGTRDRWGYLLLYEH